MYENYIEYHDIPCGAVIERIIKKENITQRELASRSGMPFQRINDYIANRRKITPEASLKLEKALNIDYQGFFYIIQANHEVFVALKIISENKKPDLSIFRETLFWDTDINSIDWDKNRKWVVKRVFEYGNEAEIMETIRFYGKEFIKFELTTITDAWNKESRIQNIEKYLK